MSASDEASEKLSDSDPFDRKSVDHASDRGSVHGDPVREMLALVNGDVPREITPAKSYSDVAGVVTCNPCGPCDAGEILRKYCGFCGFCDVAWDESTPLRGLGEEAETGDRSDCAACGVGKRPMGIDSSLRIEDAFEVGDTGDGESGANGINGLDYDRSEHYHGLGSTRESLTFSIISKLVSGAAVFRCLNVVSRLNVCISLSTRPSSSTLDLP